jgi:hypothetical protein
VAANVARPIQGRRSSHAFRQQQRSTALADKTPPDVDAVACDPNLSRHELLRA